MINRYLRIFLLPLTFVGACGGGAAQGSEPAAAGPSSASTGGAVADEISGPPRPWEEMSLDEQKEYMAQEVMPRMSALFEGFDSERFAGFSCDGCHGADMQERGFEMPNPHILALHPTGTDEQKQMVRDHPQMVRFMFNQVLPTMQKLLGAPAFDETTGEGFSCYACHPGAGAPAEGETPTEAATPDA